MRSVGIVVGSLRMGGAERTAVALADHFLRAGLDVAVLAITDEGPDHFALPAAVRLERVTMPRAAGRSLRRRGNTLARARALRAILRDLRPDAVVALGSVESILALLACLGLDVPVVASVRTDPRREPRWGFVSVARRLLFPLARSLVIQTETLRPWARRLVPAGRVHVVPNAAHPPAPVGRVEHRRPAVVAVGRLNREKGFDLLVRAFAATREAHPRWTLHIHGEGPERAALESLIRELGIEDAVHLPGAIDHPDAAMRAADVFVLSSLREGFPNVLLEGMANGCACVAFDCECGPRDIVRDGVDGLLVPAADAPALAVALSRLMGDAALRRALAARAPECLERFSMDRIGATWMRLLFPS